MRPVFLLVSLACLGAGLLFGALNPQPARIDLYWFAFDGALGVLLLAAALIGALGGGFALLVGVVWPLRRRLRQARRALAAPEGTAAVSATSLPAPDAESR